MGGVSKARNKGLDLVTGEFVTFSDSDDVLETTAVESMVNAAVKHDADVVKTSYIRRSKDGIEKPVDSEEIFVTEEKSLFFTHCQRHHYYGFLWNSMIRSSIAKKIRFDEKLQWLEDNIYIYQCFMYAQKFVAIPNVTYNYMIRDVDSLSSVRDPQLIMRASRKELFVKQSLLNGCDIDMHRNNWQVFHNRELFAISNLYLGIFNKEYRKTFLNKYVTIDEDNPILIVKLFFNTSYPFFMKDMILKVTFVLIHLLKAVKHLW